MLIDLKMVDDIPTIEMAIFMTLTVVLCKGAAWLMRLFLTTLVVMWSWPGA